MDIPSLFMIPSAVSSGKVHSVFPNSTDADFDFNRDSDATRVNSEGLIERVGYYGSELITNGDFATDSNWTKGAGWTIANGKATVTSSITDSIYQDALTLGKTFKVTFQITNITSGSLRVGIGINFSDYFTEVGTYTFYGQPSNDTFLRINPSSGTNASIDNVSVKEITGDRARLNYEIEGGLVNTKPSLLLEPQRTNRLNTSNVFTNWVISGNITITANQIISPDGTKNASIIDFSSATSSSNGVYVFGGSPSSAPSRSIYLKGAIGGETLNFSDPNQGGGSSITLTNKWQRFDYTGGSAALCGIWLKNSVGNVIHAFGAQIEEGTYPTSYIPTNGSTQTRAAETCNGAGTSSILPSEEGILYAEIAALVTGGENRVITISDGSYNNSSRIQLYTNTNEIEMRTVVGGAIQALERVAISNTLDFNKIAYKYKANDFQLYVNGSKLRFDTNGSVSAAGTYNTINFDDGGGNADFYGKVRDIRVYNTKEMTDSEVDILLTKITS